MADKESIERIIDQIREDGEKEIASIIEKAEKTAEGIVDKARQNAEETAGKVLKEAREKGELARRRLLSSVNIEVKRARLKAREEVISRINDEVRGRLGKARSSDDYAGILAYLVEEAVTALEGDTFQVYADRRDIALLEEKVFEEVRERLAKAGRKVAKFEALPLEKESLGGARVGVPGGRVIYDNTFEARMYRLRDRARNLIFEEIFETE